MKSSSGSYIRNSDMFEIVNHKGLYRSAGIGGSITGMGFSGCGVIDDPLKNREESESKNIRDKIYEWYTDVFFTRRENEAPILITMTRWHADDLAGRLLDLSESELGTSKVRIIKLPALSEEPIPDYDQRKKAGMSLWNEKFPNKLLYKIKNTVPAYTWLSLYQQRPAAITGNLFKREHFRYARREGDFLIYSDKKTYIEDCQIFQTCDPAASTKSSADYFVMATWARTKDNYLILMDLIRTRLESPDQINLFWEEYKRWHPLTQYVESVGIGKTLFQTLVREGLPVKEVKVDADKTSRAIPAAARIESGTLFFMENASWLPDLEDELMTFPNGAHDDQCDVISQAVSVLVEDKTIDDFDISLFFPSQNAEFTRKIHKYL